MKFRTVPEAPTIANLTNCRTPRRRSVAHESARLRNPVPIGEQNRKEPQQRQREGENHVVDPGTLAPAREDREHREEDEREPRHGH